MMTSAQIRQSFLDFFREKQHTIVPSSSLLPDSPNLLFTNAGMNQFVPIFLGERRADVSRWAGAVPGSDTRAADTQKCIRAGGKHNDLEDVGIDTYHHTFFEMLGNWSFGDYFKKEAIEWAWELIVERWGFPPARLYATIYQPDASMGDPAERDEEAWGLWAAKFQAAGLDPAVHIVNGNKKDNFWMMGETGPCGPCSELHVDLTPAGDTHGRLVNQGSPECIEIWNLVFIQFNANVDGSFSPLPAQHVDTGMGFERVASIIQGTKGFSDFANAKISNYETDVFRPIFDELESMSGKKYGSTLPPPNEQGVVVARDEQEAVDIAFRVIADHIRTLSFAIADGIQPGNSDRQYVLRRILRRAVKYGRNLGFTQPFFYKLADVLAKHMENVFPELRVKLQTVKDTLKREEETFNRTLDKGIALFEAEAAKLLQARGAHAPSRAVSGALAGNSGDAVYSRRNLPHFERPWAKYMVTFTTQDKRVLSPAERDLVLESLLYGDKHDQYHLYAACVMPDHVHALLEPQVKELGNKEESVFFSLTEILQAIKSSTAHRINKLTGSQGVSVWQRETFDRIIRSEADLQEKYSYIIRNPWTAQIAARGEGYSWVWTPEEAAARAPQPTREGACAPQPAAAPLISGAFAFRMYDEQGFPLDLTELMARERGLTVDTAGFETHMAAQRARARAAQKKSVIELSEIETKEATYFLGYDQEQTEAVVAEVLNIKGKTAVILNNSVLYAEMGGQVGDTGELTGTASSWRIANTQKSGLTFLHLLEEAEDAPVVGAQLQVQFDKPRRAAIQRHHTVTHMLHWALHEVVSPDATQKGSFVGPDKLTFDFNGAALTAEQVREIECLVNERIVENAPVTWREVPYADVRTRADIMQAFGDKYGERVRVVQIGGKSEALNGYSMELCGGTHVRHTGEIGLFRIVSEGAVAAGVRRIEAVAGLAARDQAVADTERLRQLAQTLGSPVGELEKKLGALLSQQRELEKQLDSLRKKQAAHTAARLVELTHPLGTVPATIVERIDGATGDELQAIAEAIRAAAFKGVVFLVGTAPDSVALVATVSPEFTSRFQAGKLIQSIAPLVGGKGGGKPDAARGAGKDPAKAADALEMVRALLAS